MRLGQAINKALNIGARHSLYNRSGEWYHKLIEFPSVLIDSNGYVFFNTKEEYITNINIKISQNSNHVHVQSGGISCLSNYQRFSLNQILVISPMLNYNVTINNEENLRLKRTLDLLQRNQVLVKKLKKLYQNTCQLCGMQLKYRKNKFYSEVHHIKPLGKPHNGPDSINNMICVCPNHHTLLDFFAMSIDLSQLKLNRHHISEEFVLYHNYTFEVNQSL